MNLKINKLIESDLKPLFQIGQLLYTSNAEDKGLNIEETDKLLSLLLEISFEEDKIKEKIEEENEKAYEEGYDEGNGDGYDKGLYEGFNNGKAEGLEEGHQKGYDEGYKEAMKLVHLNAIKEEKNNVEIVEEVGVKSGVHKRNYMDIYSPPGTRVRFMNKGGYEIQPKQAIKEGLIEEEVYTVSYIDVGSWTSYVYLKEFPNKSFNTVMFDQVEEDEV